MIVVSTEEQILALEPIDLDFSLEAGSVGQVVGGPWRKDLPESWRNNHRMANCYHPLQALRISENCYCTYHLPYFRRRLCPAETAETHLGLRVIASFQAIYD